MGYSLSDKFLAVIFLIISIISIALNLTVISKFSKIKNSNKFGLGSYITNTSIVMTLLFCFPIFIIIENADLSFLPYMRSFMKWLIIAAMVEYFVHSVYVISKLDDNLKDKKGLTVLCIFNLLFTLVSLGLTLYVGYRVREKYSAEETLKTTQTDLEKIDLYTTMYLYMFRNSLTQSDRETELLHQMIKMYEDSRLKAEIYTMIRNVIDGRYKDTEFFNNKIEVIKQKLSQNQSPVVFEFRGVPEALLPYDRMTFIEFINTFVNDLRNPNKLVSSDERNYNNIKEFFDKIVEHEGKNDNLLKYFIEEFLKKDLSSFNISTDRLQQVTANFEKERSRLNDNEVSRSISS